MAAFSKSVRAGIAAMRAARITGTASTPASPAVDAEPGSDIPLTKSGYIVVAG